ncbi:YidH family protein [Lysobacter auxotrophicus]|uniref:DUF202 domain-containing protein n=1 Tax=Lysobacter auxotrophicus TaxID=2992573 RepID=A0ABM8DE15_9GAMM|nr:DUF202 domain-containing protein [Lysobacter auxotrophicus]BDU16802.1 DUF202 domain-containing protein [Lysobacter auxotrophicus]
MSSTNDEAPIRPERVTEAPLPAIPEVSQLDPDIASVTLSQHRTKLSTHRTGLSEHRTDLSEYRTDLSTSRTEMSMRRTGMSFQRTRMSAERTLMSVIRTALSLIGFGFTIFQVFSKGRDSGLLKIGTAAPSNFGMALVMLGVLLLVVGIVYHVNFMRTLRAQRNAMVQHGLVHGESAYPVSYTLLTACALLLIGLYAIVTMVFDVARG